MQEMSMTKPVGNYIVLSQIDTLFVSKKQEHKGGQRKHVVCVLQLAKAAWGWEEATAANVQTYY